MSGGSGEASDTFTVPLFVLLDQLDIAQHGSEQVIEIMRDPTGELPHCLHLLCLVQSTLRSLSLCNFRLQSCVYRDQLLGPSRQLLCSFGEVEVQPQPARKCAIEMTGCE